MTWFDLSGFRIVFLYITFPSPLTPRDWWENTCTVGERHGRSKGTKGVGGVEVKMSLFLAKKGSGRLRDGVYLRLFFYPFRDCWNNWVPPLDLPLEWHRTNQLLIVHSWVFTLGLPQKGQKANLLSIFYLLWSQINSRHVHSGFFTCITQGPFGW